MKSIFNILLLGVALGLPAAGSAQGLLHARQMIFGMDCAPCAFGVEKGLKALPGVAADTVVVSLNEGYAELALTRGATTSLADIRRVISNNGFTPRQAEVRMEGELRLAPQARLQAGTTSYALHFDGAAESEVPDGWAPPQPVVVTGTVAGPPFEIDVERIELAQPY